jgi:hypothetical protein
MEAFREDGFRFIFYSNDHDPSHVHVKKRGGGEVIIYLGSETEPPTIRENRRMSERDAMKVIKICYERQEELLKIWEKVHG